MARHSRAHIRFHRDRVIEKRKAQAHSVLGGRVDRPAGELVHEQAWIGCSRARCGICHPDKRWHRGADRQRAEREWRSLELAA